MKDLLAVITPVSGDSLEPAAAYALALGSFKGAHVSVLIAEIESGSTIPQIEPDNVQGGNKRTKTLSTTEHLARTAEFIEAAATLANVPCTVLANERRSLSLRENVIASAQVRDLTILDVHGPLRYPRQGLVEGILFRSGRPIVLVPSIARPLDQGKILVGWDATRSAVRAVHDALPLLMAREVIIMSVVDDKEFQALHSGRDLCHYLRRWDVDARFQTAKRGSKTVGGVLVDHARRMEASLLVMGGFGHDREREFIFGSATRDIFKSHLEIPVLLSH